MIDKEELARIQVRAACGWLDPYTEKTDIQRAWSDVDRLMIHIRDLERELHRAKNPNWKPQPWSCYEDVGFEMYDKNGEQVKRPSVGDKVFTQFISGMTLCTVTGTDKPTGLTSGGNVSYLIERDGVLLASGGWINRAAVAKLNLYKSSPKPSVEKFSEKQEEKLAEQLDKMPGDTAEEKIRKSITDVQPLWGDMPCPGRDGKLGHCTEHEFCCYCQTDSLAPPCVVAEEKAATQLQSTDYVKPEESSEFKALEAIRLDEDRRFIECAICHEKEKT